MKIGAADQKEKMPLATSKLKSSTMILRILTFCLFLIVFALAIEDQICNDNECYPRIFVPTEEFQVVKEGQELPKGRLSKIQF
jgi:hypothetical protein